MEREFLLCVDDTDELGGEISTGGLAEEIALYMGSFAKISFITRHQLLLDPRINYTSHNSSMCLVAEISTKQREKVLNFALHLITSKCAKSSEPGLAAVFKDEITDRSRLIEFGKSAKEKLITIEKACEMAKQQNIFLKSIKPNAHGVIGALAGIGLRLSGNDGKVRGKFKPNAQKLSVNELLSLPYIKAVMDESFKPLANDEMINLNEAIKPIFWDHKPTLLVRKEASGFRNLGVKELREF